MGETHVIPRGQNGCPTTDETRRDAKRISLEIPESVEAEIIALLTQPLAPGENCRQAAEHRELALREIFARVTPAQALVLGRRLDSDRDSDRVVVAFRRLCVERRQRLRRYLADTKRRAAISSNQQGSDRRQGAA